VARAPYGGSQGRMLQGSACTLNKGVKMKIIPNLRFTGYLEVTCALFCLVQPQRAINTGHCQDALGPPRTTGHHCGDAHVLYMHYNRADTHAHCSFPVQNARCTMYITNSAKRDQDGSTLISVTWEVYPQTLTCAPPIMSPPSTSPAQLSMY